jgi:hypothetical protein
MEARASRSCVPVLAHRPLLIALPLPHERDARAYIALLDAGAWPRHNHCCTLLLLCILLR